MNFRRRYSDSAPGDIDQMIKDENDPEMRELLIMVNNINNNVQATARDLRDLTSKVDAHIQQFTLHAQEDAALLNKGRGMLMLKKVLWGLMGGLFVILQAGIAYTWVQVSKDLDGIHAAIVTSQITDARTESEVESLEHRLFEHLKQPEAPKTGLHK